MNIDIIWICTGVLVAACSLYGIRRWIRRGLMPHKELKAWARVVGVKPRRFESYRSLRRRVTDVMVGTK